jgi:hypothetical protein
VIGHSYDLVLLKNYSALALEYCIVVALNGIMIGLEVFSGFRLPEHLPVLLLAENEATKVQLTPLHGSCLTSI